jgi:hypothetical protein
MKTHQNIISNFLIMKIKGVIFNQTQKVLESIQQELILSDQNHLIIKVLGFCINRADILETKGLYKGVD